MNNTTIINPFHSNNSNIANIKTQHRQIMTTITDRILKFEPIIKKPIVANYKFLTVITFSRINSTVTQHLLNPFIEIKKLIFICLKNIVIKIIYNFVVYSFISTVV